MLLKKTDIVFDRYREIVVEKSKIPWINITKTGKIILDVNLLAKYITVGKYDTGENIIDYKIVNRKDVFLYVAGKWKLVDEDEFKGHIFRLIPSEVRNRRNKAELWNEVIENPDNSKRCSFGDFNKQENYISFLDGYLNIKTKELIEHTPKILNTIQIPCKYSDVLASKGKAPHFDKYMDDLCVGKEDYKTLLKEFIGFTISNIPGEKVKKFLYMKGKGNCGKSQLRILVEYLLGEENCITIQPGETTEKFRLAELYGKRLAGHGEVKCDTVSNLGNLKALTGGDSVSSDRKHKGSITYVFHGVFWFNSNNWLRFGGDKGKEVFDRMIPLEFNNVIPEEKRNPYLIDEMKNEKAAIVYQALEALYNFIENKYHFHLNDDIEELKLKLKSENSTAMQFIESCFVKSDENRRQKTLKSMFYVKYKEWCNVSGNVAKTKQNFYREVEEIYGDDFFCNIHGNVYVRDYIYDETLFKRETIADYSNIYISEDDLYELEHGKEALEKKKIIDLEKAKIEKEMLDKQNTVNIINEYKNESYTIDDIWRI